MQNVQESERIQRANPPYVIVASNGMLTGGRSVGHAERLLDDPRATVLFVGYQGEGTLGGHLMRGAERARINGRDMPIRATIRSLDGFSAHADEPELLAWLGGFIKGRRPGDKGVPARVYLVHGDPPAQEALSPKVEALGLPVDDPGLAPDGADRLRPGVGARRRSGQRTRPGRATTPSLAERTRARPRATCGAGSDPAADPRGTRLGPRVRATIR